MRFIIYSLLMGCSQSVAVAPNEMSPEKIPRFKSKKSSNYSYLELQETSTGTYVISPRTKMKLQVSKNEDFLTHHLSNELCLSPYASAYKIRARQIIQHYMFNDLSHNIHREQSTSMLTQFALKAWFQRTFIDCLQRAQNQYFGHDVSYESIRERIAEQYSFQIYKMGEFINAGLGKFGDGKSRVKVPLSLILFNSDSALFPLLTRLQQKYPLVQQDHNITYPEIKTTNQNINLLKLIDSKCYSDPKSLNIQTIFDDLKLLIDDANDLSNDFRTDMLELLGKDVLTDCKVKRNKQGDNVTYNASAMRRVFIKWSQTLIERIPDACILPQFIDFIRSKKDMANNFIFKSIVSETTHQMVIKCLSQLMESLKYRAGSLEPRQEFGLFLYDLLRCKTTRKTGQQIVSLLQTLKSTNITASGKLFEVVRIKNRFKSATRDILVNFRYGDHLVAEAQFCIDSPHDSIEISKRIKFRHYLYQLQRGLFGPTFELIMEYEDFSRTDIRVTLKAQGKLKKRNFNIKENKIKKAGRLCPQKHDMVSIKGNIFSETKFSEIINDNEGFFNCDFCFEKASLNKEYHYCYYCTAFYCLKCLNVYKSTDFSRIYWSCNQYQLLNFITSEQQVQQICKNNKTALIIAYQQGRTASRLYLDQVIYLLSTFSSQGKARPKVYAINLAHKSCQTFKKKYQITRIPTTILFNSQEEPQLTLVGSTFHDIEGFFEVQKRIQSNLPKGIKIKCNICNEIMSCQKQSKSQKCQMCMDANKIEDIGDLIRAFKFTTKDFVCKNEHVKCHYCSYLSSNSPSYFRDHTGRSYLSNKILLFPSYCSNLHLMRCFPQPKSFKCYKCKQQIESISADGDVYCCPECQEYICDQCLQTQSSNFRERELKEQLKSFEIVSHFVEDQAEEAWPCGCGNYFLKVYQTKKEKKKGIHSLLDRIMTHRKNQWTCFLCKEVCTTLKLHFACFYCPYAQIIDKETNHIEICMNCCMKSGLIDKKKYLQSIRQTVSLNCSKGHPTIKKSSRQNQQTYFECISCKENFYSNTQRFECQQCNFKCCCSCADKFLIDPDQPVTTKSCSLGHQLILKRQKPSLQFCNLCSRYIQGSYFSCCSDCRFSICVKCSQK